MNNFWTNEKLGRHHSVAKQAELLYEHYALCSADKLLSRLMESKFKFGNYGPVAWKDFLLAANLDDCLKDEYVTEALKVTTARPAIGKGEFLFVSVFKNVGFAKERGDLVDLDTHKTIEVKGINSKLGNGHSSKFEALTNTKLQTIYSSLLHTTAPNKLDNYTKTILQKSIGQDYKLAYNILSRLQNTTQSNNDINMVETAARIYVEANSESNRDILRIIAAMHLLAYARLEQFAYLLAVNNDKFMCFIAPTTITQALQILSRFEINQWAVGESGVSITLK